VQGVLWIFDLSGPNLKKDSRSDHQRGAAAVFEHYGLKSMFPHNNRNNFLMSRPELLFGSLRASDLTDSTSTAQRLPLAPDYQYHSWLHPRFLYSTGRMHSGWTASVAQDNVSIFSKIVSAISMSLSFFLARSGRYTPLSSHFFLSLLPVESQPPNVRLRSPFEPAFHDVSFLEVQWLSCGTLVMLFYPDSYATWRCLGGPIPRSVLPDNLEIFLAPFGVPAIHAAPVPQQDPKRSGGDKMSPEAKNSIQSPKPTIIANLRQRGIKLSDDCKWSSVRIDPSNETVADDGITHILPQFLIEWPTDLCFYRGYQADSEQRETSWLWPGLVNGARDPLKEADEWIRDKQRRDSALEKSRQEMEAEAKKSTMVLSTTEDLRSGKPSMVDQQIDAQSVSGVYPTPPDGFRSQAPGLNPELESSNTAKEQVDIDMLDEEKEGSRTVKADDTADNALHDVEMNMGAYDNLEEDEMFGNLHSTMFSANGLTEDDFSFFDEPKEVTNMISNIHQAKDVQAILPPYLTPTDTVMLSEKVEGDEDIPMNDDYDESNEVFEIGNTEVNTLRSDVMEEPESQSEAMQQASKRSSPRKADYNRHRGDSLQEADIQLSIRPSKAMYAQKDSVFSAIPLKLVSRSLDDKYKDQGIYCSIEDHKVDGLPPKQYQLDKVIPMINQGIAHNNNTGDDDDTSESPTTSEVSSDSFLGMMDLAERQSHSASCVASPTSMKEERTEGVSPQVLQISDSPISYEGDPGLSPHTLQSFLSDIYTGETTTFIQVAQILADQLRVYSTLERLEILSLNLYGDIFPMSEKSYPTQYDDPLRGIISTLFPQSEKCSLETCASTGETYRGIMQSQKAVVRPLQRRIDSARGSSDNMGSSTPIFPIDIPTIQALRGENLMELTATGLQFWDELGLSPSLGPKDIMAFCIYPNTQMVHRGVISFMEQLSMTYQSLRLGTHDWGNGNIKDFTEGFAPVPISYECMETTASHLDKVCERLGMYS
jgi:mediator of RNA polymerase II transcription subunit 13